MEAVRLLREAEASVGSAIGGIDAHHAEIAEPPDPVVPCLQLFLDVVEDPLRLVFVRDPEKHGEDRIDGKVVLDEVAVAVVDVIPLFVVPKEPVDRAFGPLRQFTVLSCKRRVPRTGDLGEAFERAGVEQFDVGNVARPVDLVRPIAVVEKRCYK